LGSFGVRFSSFEGAGVLVMFDTPTQRGPEQTEHAEPRHDSHSSRSVRSGCSGSGR
jgi:hypothetical protein